MPNQPDLPHCTTPQTLHDHLRVRADGPSDRGFRFLDASGDEELFLSFPALAAWAGEIGHSLLERCAPGDTVLLLYPPGPEYLGAFFGCLCAGLVAVPAYPPDPARLEATVPRLAGIAENAAPRAVLCARAADDPVVSRLQDEVPRLATAHWLSVPIAQRKAVDWPKVDVAGDDVAFLQYTSGSTAAPRGVMLPHRTLLCNIEMIGASLRRSPGDVFVSWLPPYHDMGLIGFVLQPVVLGAQTVMMSPATFLRRPRVWLETIGRFRGTVSAGPNFAYNLCVDKIPPGDRGGLDLSSWSSADIGTEPVSPATLRRFSEAFAPYGFDRSSFVPAYGLAEATLLVSAERESAFPRSLELPANGHGTSRQATIEVVSSGRPAVEELLIVDPATQRPLLDGEPGEIWVFGPNVGAGYWKLEEETQRVFQARSSARANRGYLRTGDIGLLDGGELFVLGRLKDLIIVRGRNHYPSDVERTAESAHAGLRRGCVAAFQCRTSAQHDPTVLLAELSAAASDEPPPHPELREIAASIRAAVSRIHDLALDHVVLLPPRTLPKTSSGKIQRWLCRERFLDGSLRAIHSDALGDTLPDGATDKDLLAASSNEVLTPTESKIQNACCEVLGQHVGRDTDLFALGGDSLTLTEILFRLEDEGIPIATDAGFAESGLTVRSLAGMLVADPARGVVASDQRSFGSELPLLPMQEEFLKLAFPERKNLGLRYYLSDDSVDVGCLQAAVCHLYRQHDALRTRFVRNGGGWQQVIEPVGVVEKQPIPERTIADPKEGASAADVLHEELISSFSVEHPSLFRAAVIRRSNGPDAVLSTSHHLVSDLVSERILQADLIAAYNQLRACKEPQLSATTSPLRLIDELGLLGEAAAFDDEIAYWAEHNERSSACLPETDTSLRPRNRYTRMRFNLPEASSAGLKARAARGRGTRLVDYLVAALARALEPCRQHDTFSFAQVHHGRTGTPSGLALARTVGCLGRLIPRTVALRDDWSLEQAVEAVAAQRRSIPGEGLGYTVLRQTGHSEVPSGSHPAFELNFNYLGEVYKGRNAQTSAPGLRALNPSFESTMDLDVHIASCFDADGLGVKLAVMAVWIGRRLTVEVTYDGLCFPASTMQEATKAYRAELLSAV